jgi:hypothetical protein
MGSNLRNPHATRCRLHLFRRRVPRLAVPPRHGAPAAGHPRPRPRRHPRIRPRALRTAVRRRRHRRPRVHLPALRRQRRTPAPAARYRAPAGRLGSSPRLRTDARGNRSRPHRTLGHLLRRRPPCTTQRPPRAEKSSATPSATSTSTAETRSNTPSATRPSSSSASSGPNSPPPLTAKGCTQNHEDHQSQAGTAPVASQPGGLDHRRGARHLPRNRDCVGASRRPHRDRRSRWRPCGTGCRRTRRRRLRGSGST